MNSLRLIERYPRLGKAHFAERFAHFEGERVAVIERHDLTYGPCSRCGAPAHRHAIEHQTCREHYRGRWFAEVCTSGHGASASNHHAPWEHPKWEGGTPSALPTKPPHSLPIDLSLPTSRKAAAD
jgi:hypothetical protein